MPPLSDEFREHWEAVSDVIQDIGHALGLLELLLEHGDPAIPQSIEEQGTFLLFTMRRLQEQGRSHLDKLWTVGGGNDLGTTTP